MRVRSELSWRRLVVGILALATLPALLAFTAPTLVPPTFPEPVPTVVLPPRATAYDLSEVRNLLPAAFGTSGKAVVLQASIEVPAGAQLIVDSATTPQLRMLSSKTAYTTI